MTDEALQQLVQLTDFLQNYAVLITLGIGLVIGLLCVLIVKKEG